MVNQISVFLENRKGQLVEMTAALCAEDIDLRAINIAETSDYGIIRLIASKPDAALDLLKKQGFLAVENKVVVAAVPDKAGGLDSVLGVMADADINIQYMYSVFGRRDDTAYMVFNVEDPLQLEQVLLSGGITCAGPSEIGITG